MGARSLLPSASALPSPPDCMLGFPFEEVLRQQSQSDLLSFEAFGDAFLRQWEGQVEGKSHYDVRAGDQTVSDGDISLLK